MTRNKKNDGLVSKVKKINPAFIKNDEGMRYIPFCDFSRHRGLVEDESVCQKRACKHYHKLYLGRSYLSEWRRRL